MVSTRCVEHENDVERSQHHTPDGWRNSQARRRLIFVPIVTAHGMDTGKMGAVLFSRGQFAQKNKKKSNLIYFFPPFQHVLSERLRLSA